MSVVMTGSMITVPLGTVLSRVSIGRDTVIVVGVPIAVAVGIAVAVAVGVAAAVAVAVGVAVALGEGVGCTPVIVIKPLV
jgi:hypothetical protein